LVPLWHVKNASKPLTSTMWFTAVKNYELRF
jgi:hypothetical protein